MVERVQERGCERHRRPFVRTSPSQQKAGSKAEHDDPDVLDRVECEQALELVLEDRVDDAHDRGHAADDEDDHTDPRGHVTEPVHEDADEPVDPHLDHHATHQRRDVRRRYRVRAWQPRVHGNETSLRSHADECRQSDRHLGGGARLDRTAASEGACVGEQQYRDPGAHAHQVRDGDVREDRPLAPGRAVRPG